MHVGDHQITLTEKKLLDRVTEFLPYLARESATFASVAISGWALSEILIAILDNRPSLGALAFPVLTIAMITTIYRAHTNYRAYVPETLLSESRESQEIFRRQEFGWQWALARKMLVDRIRDLDTELERIRRGAEFLEPRQLNPTDYYLWLRNRPETIIRLVKAIATLCTSDLPASIGTTIMEKDVERMKIEVEALARLYETATTFERDCHCIVAPKEFEDVHKMTHGWTDTIRDGIHEFAKIVARLASFDKSTGRNEAKKLLTFKIDFQVPKNIERFRTRLAEVDPSVLNPTTRRRGQILR